MKFIKLIQTCRQLAADGINSFEDVERFVGRWIMEIV